MSPAVTARLRLAGILVLALVLQTTVVPDLRILGVCADLLLLTTVCAGLVGGPEMGALVGFAAGLLADFFLTTTPLGLSALVFSLVGYVVGSIRRTVLQEGWLLAPGTALVASGAGVILFVIVGVMVGQSQLTRMGPVEIVKTAALVGIMNAIVAAPMCRLVGWAASGATTSWGSGSSRSGSSGGELTATAARRSARPSSSRLAHGPGRGGPAGRSR